MYKKTTISALIAITLFSTQAHALFYADIDAGYANTGANTVNGWENQRNGLFGYQANVGIYFLPFLAAEVGYNGFTNVDYKQNNVSSNASLNGYHVALKGEIDLPLDLYVMGKGGIGSLVQGSFSNVDTKTNYNFYWSVGAGYNLTDTFYFEGAYTQMQGSNDVPTAGLISLGVGINIL